MSEQQTSKELVDQIRSECRLVGFDWPSNDTKRSGPPERVICSDPTAIRNAVWHRSKLLGIVDGVLKALREAGYVGDDPIAGIRGLRLLFDAERAGNEPAAEQRPPMIDGIDSGLALQMADRADRAGYLTQNDKALIVLARAHRELRERFAKACGEVTRLSQPPGVRLPDDPRELLVTTARDAGFSDHQWKAMFYESGPYDVTFPCFTTKKFIALLLERLQSSETKEAGQ